MLSHALPALNAAASADEVFSCRVTMCDTEWQAMRCAWDELYAASPTASAALDFAWLQTWWTAYSASFDTAELRIITVWCTDRMIGALPLYTCLTRCGPLALRRLCLMSTGEAEFEESCADYLNVLIVPREEAACMDAIWRAIDQIDWHHLQFQDLPEDTPLLNPRSAPHRIRAHQRGQCLIADLTGGFEAYLERLSPNRRQQARRLMREGKRAGAALELVSADHAEHAFDDLVRLHQERWIADGDVGVFAAPRFLEFHRSLVRQWLPTGRGLLAQLSVGSTPVAVLYGFITGKKFDFYQSGVQFGPTAPLKSPGNLAHLLLMKTLAERGIDAYDFLRGASTYKQRLANRGCELIGIEIWRPSLRVALYRSIEFAGRVVRKGLQFVS
ncbi:MAG TPA: GNAT family N-acetyltransferase [Rhodoferax sp.]|nr:GNAT family N-acetyltransferase [Rhodoferax sp.]